MQQMMEFFEMVSLNEAALRESERTAMLQARLALRVFQRAMGRLHMETVEDTTGAETIAAAA